MNRLKTRSVLRDLPVFQTVSRTATEALEIASTCCALCPGEFLYQQGDLAASVYFVIQGGIRLVEHTREGQDVHLKVYSRGDVFGVLAVSDESPHASGAQAIGDTLVAAIAGRDLRDLIGQYPELGLFVIDHLVNHVRTSHGRIRQLAVERVERRLARAVMHYANKFGSPVADTISIDVPLTQKDLADFIGTTPETVNRILKQWEQNALIRCSRQHIDVLAADVLATMIEDVVYMGQVM